MHLAGLKGDALALDRDVFGTSRDGGCGGQGGEEGEDVEELHLDDWRRKTLEVNSARDGDELELGRDGAADGTNEDESSWKKKEGIIWSIYFPSLTRT